VFVKWSLLGFFVVKGILLEKSSGISLSAVPI
jgi:hypothetical protein